MFFIIYLFILYLFWCTLYLHILPILVFSCPYTLFFTLFHREPTSTPHLHSLTLSTHNVHVFLYIFVISSLLLLCFSIHSRNHSLSFSHPSTLFFTPDAMELPISTHYVPPSQHDHIHHRMTLIHHFVILEYCMLPPHKKISLSATANTFLHYF